MNDPEPLVPVSRLAALPVDFAETVVERRMPDGEATFRKISMPAWIAPKAVGQTPYVQSAAANPRPDFKRGARIRPTAEVFRPSSSTSPTGEASDCDQRERLAICERSAPSEPPTAKVLLINIHIATTSDSRSLLFPTEEEIPADNRYARLLHDCSSPMPEEAFRGDPTGAGRSGPNHPSGE